MMMKAAPPPSSITSRLCVTNLNLAQSHHHRRRIISTIGNNNNNNNNYYYYYYYSYYDHYYYYYYYYKNYNKNDNKALGSPLRRMSTSSSQAPMTKFGPYEVTTQVFHRTAHSFALVNIKPLLPGHVLVCPLVPHRRLTDLAPAELTDLFTAVQRVQHMLARKFFPASGKASTSASSSSSFPCADPAAAATVNVVGGSFNIAVQDGPEAGQTVPHVHVHIIPRPSGSAVAARAGEPDELYVGMANEDGNVGGALWDSQVNGRQRPIPGGGFPRIEDADRTARSMTEMEVEAAEFRELLRRMDYEDKYQKTPSGVGR